MMGMSSLHEVGLVGDLPPVLCLCLCTEDLLVCRSGHITENRLLRCVGMFSYFTISLSLVVVHPLSVLILVNVDSADFSFSLFFLGVTV